MQMLCSHLVCLPRVCPLCKPGSTRCRNASDVCRGVKCHISLSLSPRIGFMCAGSSSAVCKCLLELASWNNSFECGFSFCSLQMYHCWQKPVFPILLVLAAIEAHCNVRDMCVMYFLIDLIQWEPVILMSGLFETICLEFAICVGSDSCSVFCWISSTFWGNSMLCVNVCHLLECKQCLPLDSMGAVFVTSSHVCSCDQVSLTPCLFVRTNSFTILLFKIGCIQRCFSVRKRVSPNQKVSKKSKTFF